jgi:predicted aconitase
LTKVQEKMLSGAQGRAMQMAMHVVVQVGEAYEAEDLVPVTGAHIDGCSLGATGMAGLEFAELLAGSGGRVKVPATLNITARDIARWREFRVPEDHAQASARMEAAYLAMGCVPSWTCAPYQYGVVPRFGETVAWAESNAINYVNSVIGARTARHGDFMDISAAITGFAPRIGLYLPHERRAGVEVRFRGLAPGRERRDALAATVGYAVGHLAQGRVPAITGLWPGITADELKALSASAASSGDMGLFHVIGVTPEARTLEEAGGGQAPAEVVEVGPGDLDPWLEALNAARSREVHLVTVGCPHFSYPEVERVAMLLAGRRVAPGVELWVQTNQTVRRWGEETGVVREIERLGGRVMTDTCILNWPLVNWSFRAVMTNSGKLAHYCRPQTGIDPLFGSLEQCVQAAVTGTAEVV